MTTDRVSLPTARSLTVVQETNAIMDAVPASTAGLEISVDSPSVGHTEANPCRAGAILLGVSHDSGQNHRLYMAADLRNRATHLVSGAATGKTTLLVNMFLQDIEHRQAAVFIDPDGDATHSLLRRIRQEMWPRVVHFKPGDPEWVPLWNPLRLFPGMDPYLLTDMLVPVFSAYSCDFGDRTEHVLRNACIGVLHMPNPCLADVCSLLRRHTSEGKRLRERVLGFVRDERVKTFFETDLDDYSENALRIAIRVVEKLLVVSRASLMLRQPQSLIDFRKILDEGQILLVDLSDLDGYDRAMLGSLILSSLHYTAYRRKQATEQVVPFSLFLDGAHQYFSSRIANLIAEARGLRMNVVFAHQYMRQLPTTDNWGLLSSGCPILGRLEPFDSQFFAKEFGGQVKPEEFLCLERFEMIARIGPEIVRFTTLPPAPMSNVDGSAIIVESRRRYYRPAAAVLQALRADGRNRAIPAIYGCA